MRQATLIRFDLSDQGSFGIFSFDGRFFYSGEQPWRDNEKNISCIPRGVYTVHWTMSPRYKRGMYLVIGVDGRYGIRFHPGNYCGDRSLGLRSHVKGCILLGRRLGFLGSPRQKAVLNSREAITEFELAMRKQPFELRILNAGDEL